MTTRTGAWTRLSKPSHLGSATQEANRVFLSPQSTQPVNMPILSPVSFLGAFKKCTLLPSLQPCRQPAGVPSQSPALSPMAPVIPCHGFNVRETSIWSTG